MRRWLPCLLLLMALTGLAQAQSVMLNPGQMTIFTVPPPIDSGDIVFKLRRAYGGRVYTYVELGIENWRRDPLVFYRHEPVFVYPYVSLQPYDGLNTQRPMVVPPRGSKFVVLGVDGADGLNATSFQIDLNGLYAATGPAKPIEVPDVAVNAEESTFRVGPLQCWRGRFKQYGRDVSVIYRCRYRGEGFGFVDSTRIRLRQEGHRALRNREERDTLAAARDYEVMRFKLSYRLPESREDLDAFPALIEWRDAFTERGLEPIALPTVTLDVDPAATQLANP